MRLFRRSSLWFLPAVLIPLAALLVMQVRFLRDFEQKYASAERNSLRNSLEKLTAEIEWRYRSSSGTALTLSELALADVSRIGDHFRRQEVPGARTYFAMRFTSSMLEAGYFDARGKEKLPTDAEIEAVKMATVSWHVAHKWQRVASPSLQVDERDPANRIILRPVLDASMHVVGVAGVILDEQLARKAMLELSTKVLERRDPQTSLLALRFDERFAKKAGDRRDYITVPLEFVFTNWRAGIRDACASPEELAASNFRNNMLWTGGSFVVLLCAVLLALGAVFRQMRLSQMKSDFVSNVSHELRTPLSSIRVFGEYMRLGRVTSAEKIREYGEYIEAEGRRLTQLINNILDFSKIESAEKKYRFCDTDVVELVEHTVAGFELPLREHGVAIAFQSHGPHPRLRIDKDAFAQVLVNLLDNAVKYSNGRKDIEVDVVSRAGEVRISVRDHGIGIPVAEQKKIFEKFYRVGSGLVHDIKGSGLGLSIVLHVVKAHGGRVEVVSEPGQGSAFTIVLPVLKQESVPDEKESRASVAVPQSSLGESK